MPARRLQLLNPPSGANGKVALKAATLDRALDGLWAAAATAATDDEGSFHRSGPRVDIDFHRTEMTRRAFLAYRKEGPSFPQLPGSIGFGAL